MTHKLSADEQSEDLRNNKRTRGSDSGRHFVIAQEAPSNSTGEGSNINVNCNYNLGSNTTNTSAPGDEQTSNVIYVNLETGSITEKLGKLSFLINSMKIEGKTKGAITNCLNGIINELTPSTPTTTVANEAISQTKGEKELANQMKASLKEMNTQISREIYKLSNQIKRLDDQTTKRFNVVHKNIKLNAFQEKQSWRHKPPPERDKRRFSTSIELLGVIRGLNQDKLVRIKQFLNTKSEIKSGDIKIDYINLHKNGNTYIHCGDAESKQKLADLLPEIGQKLNEVERKFDFFKIGPISYETSQEEAEKAIRNKFENLNEYENRNSQISFHTKIRYNDHSRFLVYKAEHKLCNNIVENKFMHIGFTRVAIETFIPLIQCHKCSRFGHMNGHCWYKKLRCPNCAEGHRLEDCQNPKNKKCANCATKGWESNHHSWAKACPIRIEYMQMRIWLKGNKLKQSKINAARASNFQANDDDLPP